jgi:hypothetical protein
LIESIELAEMWSNLDGSVQTWFHPRICRLPSHSENALLMTVQTISGSDVYGPVHWSLSTDLGRTWSRPEPIPGMGRRRMPDGVEEGYCDTVPEYHAPTRTALALAHNVYYQNNRLTRPSEARYPVYAVRDARGGWSAPRRLEWDHPDATAMYTSGCSQRVTLASGDILVPLSFGPLGRDDRGVASVRCSFDGRELKIRDLGNVLRFSQGRGLLEPSLTRFDGRFYMTIRAENSQGFATWSFDGLQWAPMRPWCWEDGEPLALSTTQQRWLVHSDGLFLVYTRRHESNLNVMRWRAPLFLAEVDVKRLCLLRASERIAIPLHGDGLRRGGEVEHLGNFHVNAASAGESLISSGTVIPSNFRGAVRIARVRWGRPNRAL